MKSLNLLLLLLLAHILADCPLQVDTISSGKRSGRMKSYLMHFVVIAATSLAFTIPYWSMRLVMALLSIALIHIGIDWVKNRILRGDKAPNELLLFTIDQLLHIGIIAFTFLYIISPPPAVSTVWQLAPITPEEPWRLGDFWASPARWPRTISLLLSAAVVYSYVLFAGSIFVRKVLDMNWIRIPITSRKDTPERTLTIGRYIGMAERALLVTFVAVGAYGAVGFVIAAKSVARFKDLEDRDFAEYYLIGTLTSSCIAVAGGLVLKGLYLLLR